MLKCFVELSSIDFNIFLQSTQRTDRFQKDRNVRKDHMEQLSTVFFLTSTPNELLTAKDFLFSNNAAFWVSTAKVLFWHGPLFFSIFTIQATFLLRGAIWNSIWIHCGKICLIALRSFLNAPPPQFKSLLFFGLNGIFDNDFKNSEINQIHVQNSCSLRLSNKIFVKCFPTPSKTFIFNNLPHTLGTIIIVNKITPHKSILNKAMTQT